MLPFDPIATTWLAFAAALAVEVVVLALPCVAIAPRASREWLARLVDPKAEQRLGRSDWIGLAGIGLTFPGLGMLALVRLLRAAPSRAWGRRQRALAWICAGVAAFGFLFFALFYILPFTGPVRALGLANLAAGAAAMLLPGAALTLARIRGNRTGPDANARMLS